jgi:hypothetical protein
MTNAMVPSSKTWGLEYIADATLPSELAEERMLFPLAVSRYSFSVMLVSSLF